MANGIKILETGRVLAQHRIFDSVPVYTAPNSFKVGTGTTTPTINDTDLETAITIAGNPTKAIVSGYPVHDDTNHNITTRSLLLTTDCNGNDITEYALVNQDGTPVAFSRAVFTKITKTSSIQAIFIEKDKLGV